MRRIILSLLCLLFLSSAYAKQIDKTTARKVALSFLQLNTNINDVTNESLNLIYQIKGTKLTQEQNEEFTYLYIFNFQQGFIIVAADDVVKPVLAYSSEGKFDTTNIPINTKKWLEDYKGQIKFAIENNLEDNDIRSLWYTLLNNISNQKKGNATQGVLPLIQTQWDQAPFYNDLCPYDAQYNQRTVTGCVATATAQIMKYWNYPTTGSGFYSYNHPKYGKLSANFGATTYQWSSMPNKVTSANNAVATLMYHCGVSINMNYGIASEGGSSAQTLDVALALKQYFGYDTTVKGIYGVSYSYANWTNILQTELNAGRPIQYAGTGSGGGHSFVCDGYDANDFYHFNWGWGGSANGYFALYALNPGSLGTGGGTGGYNTNQRAIIGIKPSTMSSPFNLKLNYPVVISPATINYVQPFTVTTNIFNAAAMPFTGDYAAAVFDNTNSFVGFVEVKSNQTLSGYSTQYGVTFSNTGMPAMMPGSYVIGVYGRPTNSTQWIPLGNFGGNTNFNTAQVIYNNAIALNANITTTPATLVKGQSASVNLNIKNTGSTTFTGKYYTALYNLDGSLAQLLDSLEDNTGLPPNYTYGSPYLNFNNASINVNAGSYLLATLHRSNSSMSVQLTGANSYPNPKKVIVKEPDYTPDVYEVNNSVNQAFNLPVTINGNTTLIRTTGSNCHVGNDYDYYKIELPPGYMYTLKPRLQDSYNNNNGNTYTLDAVFSYSFNSTSWSDAYDDTLISPLVLNNGGTLYIAVAPYFTGNIGTYLFEVEITRSATLPVDLISFNAELKNKYVYLDWKTGNEINSNYFEIEKSINSINFKTIGKIKAATNANSLVNYSLVDSFPVIGKNYYRIKQVDIDGKYIYSDIRSVALQKSDVEFLVVPNPAKNKCLIQFDKPLNKFKVVITDVMGKILRIEHSGMNATNNLELEISGLSSGTYTITVITDNDVISQKLIVLK